MPTLYDDDQTAPVIPTAADIASDSGAERRRLAAYETELRDLSRRLILADLPSAARRVEDAADIVHAARLAIGST